MEPRISSDYQTGLSHYKAGRLDEALASMDGLLQLNQEDYQALRLKGVIHSQRAEHSAAISALSKVVESNLNNAPDLYNLGLAFQAAGDTPSACDCYGRALQANPGYDPARRGLDSLPAVDGGAGGVVPPDGASLPPPNNFPADFRRETRDRLAALPGIGSWLVAEAERGTVAVGTLDQVFAALVCCLESNCTADPADKVIRPNRALDSGPETYGSVRDDVIQINSFDTAPDGYGYRHCIGRLSGETYFIAGHQELLALAEKMGAKTVNPGDLNLPADSARAGEAESGGQVGPPAAVQTPRDAAELVKEFRLALMGRDTAKGMALIGAHADICRARDHLGLTVLHLACGFGCMEAVSALISAGADVNARDKDGLTPLHIAAARGQLETAKAVVAAGADVGVRTKQGWTPEDAAKQGGHDAIRDWLASQRAAKSSTQAGLGATQKSVGAQVGPAEAAGEPWQRFSDYVSIREGAGEDDVVHNARLQFMFQDAPHAEQLLRGLPAELSSKLPAPHLEGPSPSDAPGKYLVWFERCRLTVGEGKRIMNHVVSGGGEIYEAFLD